MSNTASKIDTVKEDFNSPQDTTSGLSLVKGGKDLTQNKVLTRKRKVSKHPLREIRIRSGCTLEELSDITKMSPSYLSRLESGSRRLNADIIQRLSLALSCNPAELLPHNNFTGTSYAAPSVSPAAAATSVDLPVYTLKGSDTKEATLETTKTEQWITRPTDFIGVTDAFACAIDDSQWAPRYMTGDRLLIHPTAPLKADCSIILTTDKKETFIGTFKGTEGTGPDQNFTMETSFSKEIKTLSFKQKEIEAFRITGTIDAS